MSIKLTELGRHEAYLRLYEILTSLPVAKGKADEYLKLERKLAAELIKEWRKAYKAALGEIMTKLGSAVNLDEKSAEVVTNTLLEALSAKFGGNKNVRQTFQKYLRESYEKGKREFAAHSHFTLPDARAIEVLTKHNCYWLGEHYGKHIGPRIAGLTSEAIEDGLGRKELAAELERALGGEVGGYKYWDVVASAALVRSRSFGCISGMEEAGITEYEILAMQDERMCPICDNMHGRVFSVATARAKINSVLNIEDPEAFKVAMPWQTEPPVDMSNQDIENAGMSLPPYHGRCRCTVVGTSHYSPLVVSFDAEAEREKIKNGYYSSTVSPQKQSRHIEGTKEYKTYSESSMKKKGKMPSVLYGDVKIAQELINKYKATGIILANGKDSVREIIQSDDFIGKYWDKNIKKYIDTMTACIIYTKKDAHIYPVWKGKFENDK